MANTVIALKKSATPAAAPTSLANGELAINYADGILYYKAANGVIASIQSLEGNSFGTVNANGTLLVSDTVGDILTVVSGNNISIVGDAINDRLTIRLADDVVIPSTGTFKVSAVGNDEGGEIKLGNAITNSVLAGDVIIDIFQNRLRFFESGGTNRGAFINIASASAGVGTDLLASSSATDTAARTTANAAFLHANAAFSVANAALPNVSGVSFNGNLTVSQNLSADRIFSTNNGLGENFKVGDDAWIGDFNIANSIRIKGQQNSQIGYVVFGDQDGKALGRAGTGALTYDSNTVWHAGNDGAGSGLDADLLDGQHGSYYGIATDVTAAFSRANTANITADRAFNHANAAFITANIAFANANTVMISAQAAFTVANSGFLHANASFAFGNSAHSIANLAFTHANAAFTNANTVMVSAQAAFTVANSSFLHANSGYAFANSISLTANAAFLHANAAFANGNTVIQTAQSAFNQANISFLHANAAFASANAGQASGNAAQATANASYAFGNSAHSIANLAFTHANAAFASSNSVNTYSNSTYVKLVAASQTITGNLAITGSLTVSGNAYTIDSQILRVSDPLIYLAGNNYVSDIVDIGFVANYVNATGSNVHTGLFRDATIKEYYLFEGYDKEPEPNHIDTAGNNFTISVLNATIKTSNLVLGGANAILTIGAAYNQANIARTFANTISINANTLYDRSNASLITANQSFDKANTANITADRAWNHANAAFATVNSAFGVANTALAVKGTITETVYGDNTSNATIAAGIYRVNYPGASDALIDIGGIGGSSPRIQMRFNYSDELYFRVARDSEVNFDTAGPFSNRVWHSGNDGASSGLDADLLDGQQGTYYGIATDVTAANRVANAAFLHANAAFATVNSAFGVANTALPNTSGVSFVGTLNFTTGNVLIGRTDSTIGAGVRLDINGAANASNLLVNGNMVFTAANDGAGSNLDADLLDGQQGSYYGIATDVTAANRVANAAFLHANAVYAYANADYAFSNSAHSIANLAFTHANNAYAKANSALANTAGISTAGALIVPGILTANAGQNGFQMRAGGSADHVYIEYYPRSATGSRGAYVGYGSAGTNTFSFINETTTGSLELGTAGGADLAIDSAGNVGIGRTNPGFKLDVVGTANASNILVNGNMVFTAANDGSGSNLDADLLDGQQGTYYGIATDVTAANRVANASFLHANASYAFSNSAHSIANLAFTHANNAYIAANTARTVVNDTVNATRYLMFANGTSGTSSLNVAVGLAFTPSSNTLNINGALNAVTKSFVIPHPVNEGMFLRYGSLEGPENGVYVRGKIEGKSIIELPEYWWNLIDQDTITVNLTPYGRSQDIWVQSTCAHFIHLNQPADCFFTVFAERKDVDKLVVEY